MEQESPQDAVTQEISTWSTFEAAKFLVFASFVAPQLVMESGKDYILNKLHGKNNHHNS